MSTYFLKKFTFSLVCTRDFTTQVVNYKLSKEKVSDKVQKEKAQARHLGHENKYPNTSVFPRIAVLDFKYNTKSTGQLND